MEQSTWHVFKKLDGNNQSPYFTNEKTEAVKG